MERSYQRLLLAGRVWLLAVILMCLPSVWVKAPQHYDNELLVRQIIMRNSPDEIDPYLFLSIAVVESSLNPKAIGEIGEIGLFQLSPICIEDLNTRLNFKITYPLDPEENARGAAIYLSWLHKQLGSVFYAILAYNWGYGNVRDWLLGEREMNPKAISYVSRVFEEYHKTRRNTK